MAPLLAHSTTYRVAVGPQAGRMVFTQTLPASDGLFDDPVCAVGGHSVHADVAAKVHDRDNPEQLCCSTDVSA